MRDLEGFRAERAKLPVDAAVERWLKLYERFKLLPPDAIKGNSLNPYAPPDAKTPSLTSLVSSIPPPAAWDILKTRLAGLPPSGNTTQDTVLRVLLAYLTRDKPALDKGMLELKAALAIAGNQRFGSGVLDLRGDLQRPGIGKGGVPTVESFESYLQSLRGERPKGQIKLLVPDLVEMAGEKRAEESILKAMAVPGVSLRVPSGGKTLDLAKRLVTSRVDLLTEPQWELVTGLSDTELYEAMNSRFPEKGAKDKSEPEIFQAVENEYQYQFQNMDTPRNTAKVLYLLGLIGKKRVADAVNLSKRMEADEFQSSEFERRWHSFDKNRYASGLNQWCRSVLTDRPELQLWKLCGLIATDSGEAVKLAAILDAAIQKPNLSLKTRLVVQSRKVDLLLAMDRTDEALSLLSTIVKADDSKETPQARLAVSRVKLRMAPRLLTLGRLLSRKELMEEGEALIMSLLAGGSVQFSMSDMAGWEGRQSLDELVDGYISDGQLAKAEQVAIAVILSTLNSPELNANALARDMALSSGAITGQLIRLAQLYDKAGRFEDTLTLLEKSRWWGATDLMDINDNVPSLAPIAARALHKSGRDAESVEILKWYLYAKPADDAAYQTLIDMLGSPLIPWLDRLQLRDRFEERPLIWKAVLLKKEGKLDEAESVVRQALKIDPTDGEQPPGDRVRGYAVLAEILRAKGKLDDAAFFERVIQSVRLAEKGDKLTEAGLLRRSLKLYEQAAEQFADAYCVQWRLAERLASIGDLAGAKKHYEIAFERMPEQFGQVAQFCFGCEGVFTHQQSVSVAEEVLTGVAKASPNKPQVHYLLGQLREAQGRKADAYTHFRRAADLDPQYLDAWKAVYGLRNDVFLSQSDMDEIALRMVRLDPLNRHSKLNHGDITDVRGLWAIYQDMGTDRMAPVKRLFTLTASKQELEELVKKFGGGIDLQEMKRTIMGKGVDVPEPGDAVVKNHFVQKLLRAAGQNILGFE
jgi:tetratricopeptide (TPR) repeat protein